MICRLRCRASGAETAAGIVIGVPMGPKPMRSARAPVTVGLGDYHQGFSRPNPRSATTLDRFPVT